MANVNPFNYDLDKITERETVYDFVSRLSIGRDFINKDYNSGTNDNDKQVILPAGMMLKDEVLMNMIRTMDTSDILHLDKIKTAYKSVGVGEKNVTIAIPDGYALYRIMQEKTGQDVTKCFTKSENNYVAIFDVPTTITDIYKAYYFVSENGPDNTPDNDDPNNGNSGGDSTPDNDDPNSGNSGSGSNPDNDNPGDNNPDNDNTGGDNIPDVYEYRYVSLGDSIAAGHSIDDNWENNYGTGSQYGSNGNLSTTIVPNSYTDLLNNEFKQTYADSDVYVYSFAHSGDTVDDLINKLSHSTVRDEIEKADVVTICIGANNILGHVYPELMPYIETGSLSSLEASVESSLSVLNTDNNSSSYVSLFNKLNEINPNAKYVFTTIYNPYRFLYIEEGREGFFKPILDLIPTIVIDIDKYIKNALGGGSWLDWIPNMDIDVSGMVKDSILNTYYIQLLFDRVNGLGKWVEKYIESADSFNGLNRILRSKINNYKSINPNFNIAETKVLFDMYPDRPYEALNNMHYNDLVNVEYTRGYTTGTMDWGALWRDIDGGAGTYWTNLVYKYFSINTDAYPSTNAVDYLHFDWENMAYELMTDTVNKVIVPDIDPHPETYGQYVLKQSFSDAMK